MKAARTSSGIVFTLQEVLVLTSKVRQLSTSFGALVFFLVLLVLLAGACFFGPWAFLRKLPPRNSMEKSAMLKRDLESVYAASEELARNSAAIMQARLSLSEERLEWRMREAPNDPEAASRRTPEELQALMESRMAKLEATRESNKKLEAQLEEAKRQIAAEESRLSRQLNRTGDALESELRMFVEKRRTLLEDKSLALQEIELLEVALAELTDQLIRAGVPREELTDPRKYLQHVDRQIQQAKERQN